MEIKLKDVGFSYNYKSSIENKILKNININFESGKIYGLIGKSGSGKSTLIQLINGLLLPNEGKITIGKYKVDNKTKAKSLKSIRSNIGLCFQCPEDQFFCHTVKDEIEFGIKNFDVKCKNIEEQVKNILDLVNLKESILDRDPFTLSHGEMRKVAIASILAYNPSIIILDEPTVGLDDFGKKDLLKLLRKLKINHDKTIIIVSHDTNFLIQIIDFVYLLEDGCIGASGDKYSIFSDEKKMKENNILVPDTLAFSNLVLKNKNVRLGYRDDINDLIKDIYRNVK